MGRDRQGERHPNRIAQSNPTAGETRGRSDVIGYAGRLMARLTF
jgi:hypothetical protein